MMKPLQITDYTLTSAAGTGVAATWQALSTGRSGLGPCRFFDIRDLTTFTGEISGVDDRK